MTALKAKTITQLLSVSTRDKPKGDYEKMQFYYHPDHLGSSSYITNLDGEVAQHIEYVPFGEVFIDELELMRKSATAGKTNCNNTWNTPYRFNDCANEGRGKLACTMPSAANRRVTLNDCANESRGKLACIMKSAANRRVELNAKEFDEETGMYYYGARYYEPRLSLWMTVDPKAEKFPKMSPYAFSNNNPIFYVDIDGFEPTPYPKALLGSVDYYKWRYNDFIKQNPGKKAPSYYLNYGNKYIQRFTNETNKLLSKQGKQWLVNARKNLQVAIEDK